MKAIRPTGTGRQTNPSLSAIACGETSGSEHRLSAIACDGSSGSEQEPNPSGRLAREDPTKRGEQPKHRGGAQKSNAKTVRAGWHARRELKRRLRRTLEQIQATDRIV
jgi:hypothetical protein